jgi:hypothetical protein
VAVVDIPNAFVQTVVSEEDAEHRNVVCIRGPLVDILVSMGCLRTICLYHQNWSEGLDCGMSQHCLWNNGGSTVVLQKVCEKFEV